MSLERVRAALLRADFRPHTLALGADAQQLGGLLSVGARGVFYLAWGAMSQPTLSELLSAEPWHDDARSAYYALDEDERMETLGYAGFYVHELAHKIDFLTTPFGAGFYGRACLETLALQRREGLLVEQLRHPSHPAFADLPRGAVDHRVREGPDALVARALWFDAQRGAASRHVKPGWEGRMEPFRILGRELPPVTVHDVVLSVGLEHGRYVRPLTILESRALAITALHLLSRLGGDDRAADEIARYLSVFYEPPEAFPDYRFLLDLFANAFGVDDVKRAIARNGVDWLRHLLVLIMVAGWYALHAPPLMPQDQSLINGSSIIRLLVALRKQEEALVARHQYASGVALLDELDADDRMTDAGIRPCREVLAHCADYVRVVRAKNRAENLHAGLREHFDHIFGVLDTQLTRRVDRGYMSMLGMPDGGNVIAGFETEHDLDQLLLDRYRPRDDVVQWFRLRENLLFRHARPPGFWEEIESFLGSPGARFVHGAYWVKTYSIDGEGRPVVQLPERAPEELHAVGLDVTTRWMAWPDRAAPLCVLRIEVGGHSLELLFGRPHQALLKAILTTGSLVLALQNDVAIGISVTADDDPVAAVLAVA